VLGICAWCGKEVGQEEGHGSAPGSRQATPLRDGTERREEEENTSTICPNCARRLTNYRKPVLVVSREWARMYDQLVELLKGQPEIEVILDRRGTGGAEWSGPERRQPESFVLR
jgi:hypothetical protein